MRPFAVVPVDPALNGALYFAEAAEAVLPDSLFLQRAEEPLDEAVLFGRVSRDELLSESVVAARGPESSTLKDQAIVASHDRLRST